METAPVEINIPPKAVLNPIRILVVEDSPFIVAILEVMFDELGWVMVGPATHLVDALELARSENFDAALLDVNLHGQMSWDVAVLLRARDIPYSFCTGYDLTKGLPAHLAGSAVISKPLDPKDVEQRLRQLMMRDDS